MIEKDYMIVGLGIAGISLCEQLQKNKKRFVVFDNNEPGATAMSGGVFNPTVLKRFTTTWNASIFLPDAKNFYKALSIKLQQTFFEEMPVLRVFKSVEEQNNWTVASDKPELQQFLSTEYIKNTNPSVYAPFGFGKVLGTAQIHTSELLAAYREYLRKENALISETVQYPAIKINNDKVIYKNYLVKKVIFSEGVKSVENPFFPENILIGNKGEFIIIKAPNLHVDVLLKGPVYVVPMGNDHYKVGATFSPNNFDVAPTEAARKEIIKKLKSFVKIPFEVVGQTSGVRPTTDDRKPLLGSLPENENLVFYNGLGSRGFMMAPKLAEILYDFMENNIPLPPEMDIMRKWT